MPPRHVQQQGAHEKGLVDVELQKAMDMFNNRCITIQTTGCCFPDLASLMSEDAWTDPELEAAKLDLNKIKSRLDAMPNG